MDRIGHLCTDPALFVKRQLLGIDKKYWGVILSPPGAAANETLLRYWDRYLTVIRSPAWCRVLKRLTRFRRVVYDATIIAINETAPYIAVERQWTARPALLCLSPRDEQRGLAWLQSKGLPDGAEFICLHNREPGYAPRDDDINTYRNSDVMSYRLAIEEMAKRGYWCIRMGGPNQRKLPPMDKAIDYAHCAERSDWLDVFLSARCKFFLGASSGLLFVADLFGRPVGAANQAPFSTVLAFSNDDVALPKLLWSERLGRLLTFREIFNSDVSNYRFTTLFERDGIRNLDNSAEELRDLAVEMLERADGAAIYTQRDEELQQRFRSLMRPGHYAYGGVNRVGREFLRKYQHLFAD